MRTPRIVIIAAFLFTTITLSFVFLQSSHTDPTYSSRGSESSRNGLRGLFPFHTPPSLFPPNAIISLTDDNTTSFLARPAAFGPLLPTKGLSGELWIGSGFGDDSLRQGTIIAGAEGELGCSDVPGWVDGNKKIGSAVDSHEIGSGKTSLSGQKAKNQRRDRGGTVPAVDRTAIAGGPTSERISLAAPSVDDGTDDYLHHPLPGSTVSRPSSSGQEAHDLSPGKSDHADIQSIQEGAEIAGKIVLLSRGGCGFLEKVKWAQRRGGIALIVGDNTRGGQLIQMYARGDTSNVSIPSIFTSHTTAHLLSSLIPPGSYIEDTIDESGKAVVKVQQSKSKKGRKKGYKHGSITTDVAGKATMTPRPASKLASVKVKGTASGSEKAVPIEVHDSGWLSWLFSKPKIDQDSESASKNGKLDWVLNEWDDKEDVSKKPLSKATIPKNQGKVSTSQSSSGDGFVIGVQDWRDPDLVDTPASTKSTIEAPHGKVEKKGPRPTGSTGRKQVGQVQQDGSKMKSGLEGGSITPGSGEYIAGLPVGKGEVKPSKNDFGGDKAADGSGLLTKLFGDDEDESAATGDWVTEEESNVDGEDPDEDDDDEDESFHEGLWVTLTPTSGASPFFDTLLVLVVSPLVTLTVVYALLLLRSRIRRRRWRAPKSVVERLPVRTYQTVTSTMQSRLPSPTSSSPTTPLLQGTVARRPRSRTTSGLPEPGILLRTNSDTPHSSRAPSRTPSRGHEHEKGAGVSNEWKKFMGRQVECVVCLEEYIDGVSRVMSLPCGHEFHVDCITPWLTTRRRTCPICKGDVVRSLARGSPSGPRYEAYRDDSDDDVEIQVNDDPRTPALIIARDTRGTGEDDIERGIVSPIPSRPRNSRIGSWRSILTRSFGSSSQSSRPAQEDRSR